MHQGRVDAAPRPGALAALRRRVRAWRNAKTADPTFQAAAVANPLTRPVARREAARLYDLVAGFVHSQVLAACVDLDLFARLAAEGPLPAAVLARACDLPEPAMARLAQAAAALGLLTRDGDAYDLGPLGAACLGAPGVIEMVRHHRALYADLADPVALLRGETAPELARFWGYVQGEDRPAEAAAFSDLMAVSQTMVADEVLAVAGLGTARHVLDVGGGAGAFLLALAARHPGPRLTLLDLPPVAEIAAARFAKAGLSGRATAVAGSFRADPLPEGADVITLVRVLYDHGDDTVAALLAKIHAALPPGGRIVIAEPMSGGARPDRVGDSYFGMYTAAMTSGRPRSVAQHRAALVQAGFRTIRAPRMRQPFVTRVVLATR